MVYDIIIYISLIVILVCYSFAHITFTVSAENYTLITIISLLSVFGLIFIPIVCVGVVFGYILAIKKIFSKTDQEQSIKDLMELHPCMTANNV